MSEPAAAPVTVVTQTRVADGREAAFATWQKTISEAVSRRPGFVKQTVIPPSPPTQLDWVILQRFADRDSATAWLQSDERKRMVAAAGSMLVGQDDVHLLRDDSDAVATPVSVVISTRVKPGREDDYRHWERKIAAVQEHAEGLQGYRFEEPMPGIQDDWLAIVRFDSEAHLQAWLDSPQRKKLVEESAAFTDEYHTRIVRTGFDQWFQMGASHGNPPSAWKQNMLVLMMLYPVVFLFGLLVHRPLLDQQLHLPFWLALFIGNAASVLILSYLVPWVSGRFQWWLQPGAGALRTNVFGALVVVAVYVVCLAAFSQLP
jgi:uncharacterized protein